MKLPPVVLGALAGLAAAAALTPVAVDALRDLRAARATRATLAQLAAGPAPSRAIVADGDAIAAPDVATAADRLAVRLRALAGRGGLSIEQTAATPSPGLTRVRVGVSGSEDAVIAFADSVERAHPAMRFAAWSARSEGGRVTLTGEVVSPWQ